MLNIVHVTTAAAIVSVVPNPVISIPLAFASHIVLDTVPHWNWSPGKSLAGILASINDGLLSLALILVFAIYLDNSWVMIAAGLASMMPDIIQAPYHFFKWQPKWLTAFIDWERHRQRWSWMKPWHGLATQIVTAVVSLWVIFS